MNKKKRIKKEYFNITTCNSIVKKIHAALKNQISSILKVSILHLGVSDKKNLLSLINIKLLIDII